MFALNTLKKAVAALVVALTVCTVKSVFAEGYMDPFVEAVGLVAHTRIAVPASRTILLFAK